MEKGWKWYRAAPGFVIFYPPSWKLVPGGREYLQIFSFVPNAGDPSEMFVGAMTKTEIHWQKLSEQDLSYNQELKFKDGVFTLNRSPFYKEINGIQAERWSGRDVLRQAKKMPVYDPNAIHDTDLTTQFVTRNTLFVIDTYTSGEADKVPMNEILLIHNSFSFE